MARKQIEPATEYRCDGCGTTHNEPQSKIAESDYVAAEYIPRGWMTLSLRQWVPSDGGVDGLQRDKLRMTSVDYCPNCKSLAGDALMTQFNDKRFNLREFHDLVVSGRNGSLRRHGTFGGNRSAL